MVAQIILPPVEIFQKLPGQMTRKLTEFASNRCQQVSPGVLIDPNWDISRGTKCILGLPVVLSLLETELVVAVVAVAVVVLCDETSRSDDDVENLPENELCVGADFCSDPFLPELPEPPPAEVPGLAALVTSPSLGVDERDHFVTTCGTVWPVTKSTKAPNLYKIAQLLSNWGQKSSHWIKFCPKLCPMILKSTKCHKIPGIWSHCLRLSIGDDSRLVLHWRIFINSWKSLSTNSCKT